MYVNHRVYMDLTNRENMPVIDVVREDLNSRRIVFILRAGFEPWCPPEGASVLIRYRKEDGTGGEYDTMPDGSAAHEINGCNMTVLLAPQIFTVEENVNLSVTLIHGDSELNIFQVRLQVAGKVPVPEKSEDYFRVTRFIPQPEAAVAGQFLEVSEVDGNGKIRAVRTAEAPAGSTAVPENVVTCDLNGSMEGESTVPVNADTLGGALPTAFARSAVLGAYCTATFPADLSLTTKEYLVWPMVVADQSGDFFEAVDGVLVCRKACVAGGSFSAFLYSGHNAQDVVYVSIFVNNEMIARAQIKVAQSGPYTTLTGTFRPCRYAIGDTITLKVQNTTGARGLVKNYSTTSFVCVKVIGEVTA